MCVGSGHDASAGRSTPKLLVFITVDALRPDYFARFERQLNGGLARLYNDGAVFTNGYQDHAITETAPGHSATMSGRYPAQHRNLRPTCRRRGSECSSHRGAGSGCIAVPFSRHDPHRLADSEGSADARAIRVEKGPRRDSSDRPLEAAGVLVRSQWKLHHEHLLRSEPARRGCASSMRAGSRRRTPAVAGVCCFPRANTPRRTACPWKARAVRFTFPHVLPRNPDSRPGCPAGLSVDGRDRRSRSRCTDCNTLDLGSGPADRRARDLAFDDRCHRPPLRSRLEGSSRPGPQTRPMLGQFLDSLFSFATSAMSSSP